MSYPAQPIFLFNEEQEMINCFNSPTLAAKQLGVSPSYIFQAIKRSSAVHGRYYLSYEPTSSFTISGVHDRNALHSGEGFNIHSRYGAGHSHKGICSEIAAGLLLLFDATFTFDHYLFGSLPLVAEQAESFSSALPNKYKP